MVSREGCQRKSVTQTNYSNVTALMLQLHYTIYLKHFFTTNGYFDGMKVCLAAAHNDIFTDGFVVFLSKKLVGTKLLI